MNLTLVTMAACFSMLGLRLSYESPIVEVPVAPSRMEGLHDVHIKNLRVSQYQCRTEIVPIEYEERIPTIQQIQSDDDAHQQSVDEAILGGLLGAVLFSKVGGGLGTTATGAGLIGGIAKSGHFDGEARHGTKTVFVMKIVKHTRYEQQEKCEVANPARNSELHADVNCQAKPVTT